MSVRHDPGADLLLIKIEPARPLPATGSAVPCRSLSAGMGQNAIDRWRRSRSCQALWRTGALRQPARPPAATTWLQAARCPRYLLRWNGAADRPLAPVAFLPGTVAYRGATPTSAPACCHNVASSGALSQVPAPMEWCSRSTGCRFRPATPACKSINTGERLFWTVEQCRVSGSLAAKGALRSWSSQNAFAMRANKRVALGVAAITPLKVA
jgi:hypothetical protein